MNIAERQHLIAAQPRPRDVALSQRGKSWVLILAGVAAAIEIGLIAYLALHVSTLRAGVIGTPAFAIALLVPFTPLILLRGLRDQKDLIQTGDVAIATVTYTSNSPLRAAPVSNSSLTVNRNDDVRTVWYQFSNQSGAVLQGTSVDGSLILREHSAMLVFYDPNNPNRQIAQCAAYYKVVAPSLDDDWLDKA